MIHIPNSGEPVVPDSFSAEAVIFRMSPVANCPAVKVMVFIEVADVAAVVAEESTVEVATLLNLVVQFVPEIQNFAAEIEPVEVALPEIHKPVPGSDGQVGPVVPITKRPVVVA